MTHLDLNARTRDKVIDTVALAGTSAPGACRVHTEAEMALFEPAFRGHVGSVPAPARNNPIGARNLIPPDCRVTAGAIYTIDRKPPRDRTPHG